MLSPLLSGNLKLPGEPPLILTAVETESADGAISANRRVGSGERTKSTLALNWDRVVSWSAVQLSVAPEKTVKVSNLN